MRYSIRLAALLRCSESLEQAARNHRRDIEELRSVIARLNGLWGMSGILSGLRRDVGDMEEQMQITLTMAQAARRIYHIYIDMERSIAEAADCPFRMDPGVISGCGPPVFPPVLTAGPAYVNEAVPASAQNAAHQDAAHRMNAQLFSLLERYLRGLPAREAAERTVRQARQQLGL